MRRIEGFSLSHFVSITPETLNSLQIFQGEHPSDQQWAINRYTALRADSLSIYGLFCSLAHTSQGKTKLRELLLRPVFDLEVIRSRQEATYLLLHPENRDRKDHIAETLRKTKNVASYIFSLRKGVTFSQGGQDFSASVWANVRTFVSQALKLRDHVNTLRGVNDCCLIRNVRRALLTPAAQRRWPLHSTDGNFLSPQITGIFETRRTVASCCWRTSTRYD